MLSELVAHYLRAVRMDDVMTHLARLTEHDRYQASLGIERAADQIASAAEAAGLVGVTVERFAADGATKWWTFVAPRAWTPTTARLEIRAAGRPVVVVDHASQPFTLATYSAPTPAAGLTARIVRGDAADVGGAIALIDATELARPGWLASLAERGAVGFVTDAPARGADPGRIELDAATALFGFSITTPRRRAIEAVGAGAEAHVRIDIDRSARMPVVTGVLPGRGDGEVWLTSHLCHPRPGANDNASGAAALLGVAAALADRRVDIDRSIRFVWGPEFLGVAALLHRRHERRGREDRPTAVINLDMVGEDPVQCGVPLVVERAPEWCASPITPLAEHVVEEVFAQTRTHAGSWRAGPFLGFSDHALFANFVDPTWRSPAVQLWHPGDPFNHTAADTLDKVSAIEMQRATVAGAVLAETTARDAGWSRAAFDRVVGAWCDRETVAAGAVAQRYRDVDRGAWSRRLVDHVRVLGDEMRALAGGGPATARPDRRTTAPAFVGRWPGPFNYRGLLAELSASRRVEVASWFAADKRNYAVLAHLAMLADRCASREQVIDAASLALRAPIDRVAGEQLWAALRESGWIEEVASGR